MALPSDATKIHLDQATDDPKQARVELADLVDKFNALKNTLGNIVESNAGEGLAVVGASPPFSLDIDLGTDSGLELITAKLRIKAIEGIQRKASNAGLSLDINGLVAEAAVEVANDYVALYDTTAGLHRKVLPSNLLPIASQAEAEAGTDNIKRMTPLRVAQALGSNIASQVSIITATNATHPVPAGANNALVFLTGGGGGGGGSGPNAGGGGGGGGSCVALIGVTSGGTINVQIGAGGTAGSASPTSGGSGGNTTIDSTLAVANGGGGGVNGGSTGGGGAGGTASTTGTALTAHTGKRGTSRPNSSTGGAGADSAYFGSHGGRAFTPGEAGFGKGSGGGGASGSGQSGGAGAPGAALIIWLS